MPREIFEMFVLHRTSNRHAADLLSRLATRTGLFVLSLAWALALAGAAGAAGLVANRAAYSAAGSSLGVVGAVILGLTLASSVGVLIAGVWMSIHRRPEGHMRPLHGWPTGQ